jgi:SAM-dependent methyltransferase
MHVANTKPSTIKRSGWLRRFQTVTRIWKTAPSRKEALREIGRRIWMFFPHYVPTEQRRNNHREFWQRHSTFQRFSEANNAATNPTAEYMDNVINKFFLLHCSSQDRVLDIGCGTGIVSLALAQYGCTVTACDVSERMLEALRARTGSLPIETHQADAYHLPFEDGEFDRVVARMFLYHFPDWPEVLKEMARCCRPGGRLLVHVTNTENVEFAREYSNFCFPLGDLPNPSRPWQRPTNYGIFASRSISRAAKRANLRLNERRPCMFFHNNPLISFSLGPDATEEYGQALEEKLAMPNVLEFVQWFEQTAVQQMPFWISYYNLLALEKL